MQYHYSKIPKDNVTFTETNSIFIVFTGAECKGLFKGQTQVIIHTLTSLAIKPGFGDNQLFMLNRVHGEDGEMVLFLYCIFACLKPFTSKSDSSIN